MGEPNREWKRIAMLGGDRREIQLAKALIDWGAQLALVGFEQDQALAGAEFFADEVLAVKGVDMVIGPMSNTDEKGLIHARLDGLEPIDLAGVIPYLAPDSYLLIGVAKPIIRRLGAVYQLQVVETSEVDEIAIYNSIPTAEGTIQLLMEELPITVHGMHCLILGYGRCGATLARSLMGLGAHVTVAARDQGQLARAYEQGAKVMLLQSTAAGGNFDAIINSIPAQVLGREFLSTLDPKTLIVDIAAAPGGVDFAAAKELGITAKQALSLPGKVAPITAGKILADHIPRLLENLAGRK